MEIFEDGLRTLNTTNKISLNPDSKTGLEVMLGGIKQLTDLQSKLYNSCTQEHTIDVRNRLQKIENYENKENFEGLLYFI